MGNTNKEFKNLLDDTLPLVAIELNPERACLASICEFLCDGRFYCVFPENIESYNNNILKISSMNNVVSYRFSLKKRIFFVQESLKKILQDNVDPPETIDGFFKDLLDVEGSYVEVIAPISGIFLDEQDGFSLSIFKFGRIKNLKYPLIDDINAEYISISIEENYDDDLAIEKAITAFSDFTRLIFFVLGKFDGTISIKTGLPLYKNMSDATMHTYTSSYQILNENGECRRDTINNFFLDRVRINNSIKDENPDFFKLWDIFSRMYNKENVNDIEKRIMNSALSLGEAASSHNLRDSTIYTCIALETLLSYDEGSIFQRSIGDKIGDMLAFIIGKNVNDRLDISRRFKKFYGLRSAIVHGGNAILKNDYIEISLLLRNAISELLDNKKFEKISKIEDLYNELKIAQYSY